MVFVRSLNGRIFVFSHFFLKSDRTEPNRTVPVRFHFGSRFYPNRKKTEPNRPVRSFSQHAPELLELLTDKLKRDKGRQRFQKGYNFSREQAFVLVPDQRICRSRTRVPPKEGGDEAGEVNICQISNIIPDGETIESIVQRIVRDNLGEKEVKAIAKALTVTSPNPVATTSRLSRLRRELRELNAPEKIISAILDDKTTCASNKIQKERRVQRENEGIDFPDHFSLESVKERLDGYDVSNAPNLQALADVMIMLCIRPAEIKDLRISNGSVTGYSKN